MDFPKEKMRFVATHGGSVSPEGWLVLDIANMDLEGVNRLYVNLAEVDRLRAAGDAHEAKLRDTRRLLGG